MNNTSLYTAQSALAQLPRQGSWLWKQAKRASSESGTDPEARGPVWNTASIWGGPRRARPGQRSVTGLWGMAPLCPSATVSPLLRPDHNHVTASLYPDLRGGSGGSGPLDFHRGHTGTSTRSTCSGGLPRGCSTEEGWCDSVCCTSELLVRLKPKTPTCRLCTLQGSCFTGEGASLTPILGQPWLLQEWGHTSGSTWARSLTEQTIMPGRPSLPVRLLWKGREDT